MSSATAPKDTTKYWGDEGTGYKTDWLGSGTEEDPWLISSAGDLAGIAYSTYYGTKSEYANGEARFNNCYFKQTCNIDVSNYWWQPIGTQYDRSGRLVERWFGGHYEGGGYSVSGVFTQSGSDNGKIHSGLFGHLESRGSIRASIKNLAVLNSHIQGGESTGSIAGFTCNANIINCYSDAMLTGQAYNIGGIVGRCYDSTTISNCYFKGTLTGNGEVGGIVGFADKQTIIVNCFNIGSVSGGNNVGQIVGFISDDVQVINCICVQGKAIGSGSGEAWAKSDLEAQAKIESFYLYASNWNSSYPWDFTNHWKILSTENDGYPVLQTENWTWHSDTSWQGDGFSEATAYQIDTPEKLAGLAKMVNSGTSYTGKYFKQTANINLDGYQWISIGNAHNVYQFCGVYDGQGYKIKGMYSEFKSNYCGLFGSIRAATIKNVSLEKSIIKSENNMIGGIVGLSDTGSTIENCHSDVRVVGNIRIGGVVGWAWKSRVLNCSFTGEVEGLAEIGGIIGRTDGCTVENCYNYGSIKGNEFVSGIVGHMNKSDEVVEVNQVLNCISSGIIDGMKYVGSITGSLDADTIKGCVGSDYIVYNDGAAYVGGIAGIVHNSTIENSCFVGYSNGEISSICDSASIGSTIISCYAYFRQHGIYTNGDFEDWALCSNLNDGLPIQKALYAVAQFGEPVDEAWFEANGFKKFV